MYKRQFLNRVDEIITFDQLSLDAIEKIIDIELKGLYEQVQYSSDPSFPQVAGTFSFFTNS